MNAQLQTGRAGEGGHWYGRDGSCCYDIQGANGNMRSVTLRDARKLGLLPGYSSIAALEAKPQLTNWMVDQALMAALTLPRLPDETDDVFMARAKYDSKQQAAKAAERGKQIHAMIEAALNGCPTPAEELPFVDPVMRILNALVVVMKATSYAGPETSFASKLGYGGKIDYRYGDLFVDFKCKDFDETKGVDKLAYDEHCMQLAAYGKGCGVVNPICVNLFISTRKPGLVLIKEWTPEEIEENYRAFLCLLGLWKVRKGYDGSF